MDFKGLFKEYKKEAIVLTLALLVVCAIASGISYSKGSKEFNQGVMQKEAYYKALKDEEYNDLVSVVENKEKKVANLEETVSDLVDDAEELRKEKHTLQDEIDANKEKIEKIEQYEEVVAGLEIEVGTLESETNRLGLHKISIENEIADLEAEVARLNGQIVEAAGAPIVLQPGMWFQEIDEIPAGRYTVSNGDSNFFVYDEDGSTYVNIILDDPGSGWGVSEYTFVLLEGSIIETKGGCTLTPVQ